MAEDEDNTDKQGAQLIVVYLTAIVYTVLLVLAVVRLSGYLLVCKRGSGRRESETMAPGMSVASAEDAFGPYPHAARTAEGTPIQVEIGDSPSRASSQYTHKGADKDSLLSTAAAAQHKQVRDQRLSAFANLKQRFKNLEHLHHDQVLKGRPPEFGVLYWLLLVHLSLMSVLYWFTANRLSFWTEHQNDDTPDTGDMNPYVFSMVVLRYLPNVLSTLIYVILYFMMERLFAVGRIQSSMQYQHEKSSKKVLKCVRIALLVMVVIFIITETICCVCVLLLGLKREYFQIQLVSYTYTIVVVANIYAITKYCKQAGTAYKSAMHEASLKHCLYVAMYWTLIQIILKLLLVEFVPELNPFVNTDPDVPKPKKLGAAKPAEQGITVMFSILSFAANLACDVVPLLMLIDSQFIKILTFDAIRQYELDQIAKKDQENAQLLNDQEKSISDLRNVDYERKIAKGQLKEELQNVKDARPRLGSEASAERFQSFSSGAELSPTSNSMRAQNNPMKYMLIYKSHDLSTNELQMKAKVLYYGELRLEDPSLFKLGEPLDFDWYHHTEKSTIKTKLGKLFHATMQKHSKEQQRRCIVRFVDFERGSAYVIEGFNNRMLSICQIQNIGSLWHQPLGYYVDPRLRLYMFYEEAHSLYELLHSQPNDEFSFNYILRHESVSTKIRIKYEIAYQLSRILLTIANLSTLKKHGHLTSHNVFVELKKIASGTFEIKVRVGDIENLDFMEYGNLFYSYKFTSVWSSPEALKNPKKIQELDERMDIYSLGMILWELWHEAVPFDGELEQAAQYVVKEESRPKIIGSVADLDLDPEDEEAKEGETPTGLKGQAAVAQQTFCDNIISSLIRKCWSADAATRPKLYEICQLLQNKIQKELNQDVVIVAI